MSLLENWQKIAYNQNQTQAELQKFWQNYFLLEKGIYEKLLDDPDTEVKGTVKELAEKYGIEVMPMVGFLDGINESLVTPNPIETSHKSKTQFKTKFKVGKILFFKQAKDKSEVKQQDKANGTQFENQRLDYKE